MKPAKFDYIRAQSIDEALQVLARFGPDAKILAGGQSLMPMMNFRLVKASVLIDINAIPNQDTITATPDGLMIRPLVRHYMTATDPMIGRELPLLHEVMPHVAHMTVRNRGTLCGSLCHADPAAEMPMIAAMFDARIESSSIRGSRSLTAAEFLTGSLMTALEADEMVTSVTLERMEPDAVWAFEEFSRRHGDFALAAFAVTYVPDADGRITRPRVAMTGVAETALRLPDLEALITGQHPGAELNEKVADWLGANLSPNNDLHASTDYRRNLAGVLARRALNKAQLRASRRAAHAN